MEPKIDQALRRPSLVLALPCDNSTGGKLERLAKTVVKVEQVPSTLWVSNGLDDGVSRAGETAESLRKRLVEHFLHMKMCRILS